MSALQTFTLKLGTLELRVSPGVWSYQDLSRCARVFKESQEQTRITNSVGVMASAVECLGVLIDLVFKAAKPNHPDLRREQFEELSLDVLMELPARLAEAQNACLLPGRIN